MCKCRTVKWNTSHKFVLEWQSGPCHGPEGKFRTTENTEKVKWQLLLISANWAKLTYWLIWYQCVIKAVCFHHLICVFKVLNHRKGISIRAGWNNGRLSHLKCQTMSHWDCRLKLNLHRKETAKATQCYLSAAVIRDFPRENNAAAHEQSPDFVCAQSTSKNAERQASFCFPPSLLWLFAYELRHCMTIAAEFQMLKGDFCKMLTSYFNLHRSSKHISCSFEASSFTGLFCFLLFSHGKTTSKTDELKWEVRKEKWA